MGVTLQQNKLLRNECVKLTSSFRHLILARVQLFFTTGILTPAFFGVYSNKH